jgi:outer membrane protein OmpA-like peptidoglycan-associated protein
MSIRSRMVMIVVASLALAAFAAAEVQLTALQLPEGKGLDVKFVPTKRAPAKATMEANLKYQKGQATVELKFEKMEPAVLFGGDISAYVLWAVTSDGVVENLGEVIVDRKEYSDSQKFTTGKKIFALMVTAEPLAVVSRPADLVLFTSGQVSPKKVRNTPFKFGEFRTEWAKPALETIAGIQYNDETPVAIKQAQKALEFAASLKAGDVNPSAMRDAQIAFNQADNTAKSNGSQKVITDYARRAVELASQAIRDTIKKNEAEAAAAAAAKRAAEKAALEQRASDAETESQRIARQLKEVESQRAALATESRELQQQRDKFAAERDAVAAQRDAVAAQRDAVKADLAKVEMERTAIQKERDELAKMLKGALSSVAETNETARGVIVNLSGILFDLNKATLKVPSQITVAKLAGILMVFQNMNLSIEGYTDSTGSDATNMMLSTDRAKTVYDFLLVQGIAPSRMKYQGFGPANPVAPNDTEANRAKNRRVEVVLNQAPKAE